MDKKTAQNISSDLEVVLKKFAEARGLQYSRKNGKFSSTDFTLPIVFTEMNEDGVAETKELRALKIYEPNLVGKSFVSQGEKHEIVGYNTRAPKFPIQTKTSRGGYKWPLDTVKRMIAA